MYITQLLPQQTSNTRRLDESILLEDPVYRQFKGVGRYIAERRMSEKEIFQVFADAEAGMTDKATGANRTMLGRGKDTTTDFAGGVAKALKTVWGDLQKSVPVSAVDVAYDQATDALTDLTGGEKGKVMQALKKYRMLAKEYPKTAGLAKGALVAITGLATGGAGLPAVAALIYGLDSAIKGEKFSDIALKAGGAAATAWAASKLAGMFGDQPAPSDASAGGLDAADQVYQGAGAGVDGGPGGTYTIMKGDQLGYIAQAQGTTPELIRAANPDINFAKALQPGQEINLPAAGTPGQGSVWSDYKGGMYGDKVPGPEPLGGGSAVDAAGAATSSQPMLSFPAGDNAGTLTLPDGTQVEAYAFPPSGPQPRLGPGLEAVSVNYAGQDVTAYVKNGKAYIKNFNPAEFSNPVQESILSAVKLLQLPVDQLIDQKSTVLNWALNESIGRRSHSVNLTTAGTYTVFENVDRYRKAVMELKGVPGSTRPEYYRPDMMNAPTKPDKKPGLVGRGLNWLDKTAGKVGGALSNFGHQFTTNVTKEKLKMNWHQKGKPSDSDQLAAWLVDEQGVPQDVVTSVYSKMGIPVSTPSPVPTPEPAPMDTNPAPTPSPTPVSINRSGIGRIAGSTEVASGLINPKTKKPYTYQELRAMGSEPETAPTTPTTPSTTPTVAPVGYNAKNVMNLPGMEKYAKQPAAPAKTANFGVPNAYSKTTTTVKPMAGVPGAKTATPAAPVAPAAPAAPGVPAAPTMKIGGQALNPKNPADKKIIDKVQAQAEKVAEALEIPVSKMLDLVETKEDVRQIKNFIDQTFVKYGMIGESAFVVRNKLIEHVTHVGAQRRREFARKNS